MRTIGGIVTALVATVAAQVGVAHLARLLGAGEYIAGACAGAVGVVAVFVVLAVTDEE